MLVERKACCHVANVFFSRSELIWLIFRLPRNVFLAKRFGRQCVEKTSKPATARQSFQKFCTSRKLGTKHKLFSLHHNGCVVRVLKSSGTTYHFLTDRIVLLSDSRRCTTQHYGYLLDMMRFMLWLSNFRGSVMVFACVGDNHFRRRTQCTQ